MLDDGSGFPRYSRLLKPAEYRAVFDRPVKSGDECFTVLCRPNDRESPRLGLAVSKKNSRLAVERNRIKRVIRESFRNNRATLGRIDYVVLSRAGTGAMRNQTLFDSLDRHWKRLRKRIADKGD